MKTIKTLIKTLVAVFFIIIVFFVIFHIYNYVNPSYVTELAVIYTMPDSVRCKGVAIRDETIIEIETEGALNFRVNDGDKVATNSVVADVYTSSNIVEDVLVFKELINERNALINADTLAKNAGLNLDAMSNGIHQTMVELKRSIESDEFSDFSINKNKLTEQLFAFTNAVNPALSTSSLVLKLDEEIQAIESRMAKSSDEIVLSKGGYFVSYTDGLEFLKYTGGSIYSIEESMGEDEEIRPFSVSDVEKVLLSSEFKQSRNSCKVISDYTWYFAAIIEPEYTSRFYEGQNLKLDLDYSINKNLPVRIVKIITDETSEHTLLIFTCDRLNSDLTGLRIEEGSISFRSYTGIRVQRSAIHMVDGEIGVFVKYDNKIFFKKITYDFETPDYVLVNISQKYGYLRLYDEIIIEGKDLFDGKSA